MIETTKLFISGCDRPIVVGAGLIALDVVIRNGEREASRAWAGGTCGNVLVILSYLGWRAYPVARLNGDAASKLVQEDFRRWGVHLDFAGSEPAGKTPVYVHRIRRDKQGIPFHTFSRRCAECDAALPSYRPPVASAARDIAARLASPHVFFLDRVSRASIIMAQASADQGALVVFEPSGVGDPGLFREVLALAHVVKYSHERRSTFHTLLVERSGTIPIEIETLGREGLRYRCALPLYSSGLWQYVSGYNVAGVRDAAGAGDWCTAGIIHMVGRDGAAGLTALTLARLQDALSLGQAFAAWNCRFEGARAGMYATSRAEFAAEVRHILGGQVAELREVNGGATVLSDPLRLICRQCARSEDRATEHAPS